MSYKSLLLPAAVALLVVYSAQAQDYKRGPAETVLREHVPIRSGGTLAIRVSDADVMVETGDTREAAIEIMLSGHNMDRARAYFKALDFTITGDNGGVIIESHQAPRMFRDWHRRGGAKILIIATVPRQFEYDIVTSDGDVSAESITGNAHIKSSDGDLRVGSIDGQEIYLKTSDGDIYADRLAAADVDISTSDGEIRISGVKAREVGIRSSDGSITIEELDGRSSVKTSDGDIRIGNASGTAISLRTSDGDISVDRLIAGSTTIITSEGEIFVQYSEGNLDATSSDGSVVLAVNSPGEVNARSGDGDIILKVPLSIGADLELRGDRVDIASGHTFTGTLEKRYASGKMNGGGAAFRATSSDGHIIISN